MSHCTKTYAVGSLQHVIVLEAVKTADNSKIRLWDAFRLPVKTADNGKIRLGGACRLPLRAN